ncbi:MAG TPA: holo-ACP synthase [Spirochaetia bacterium]|nr:holo-ACP synthase [Spirochaetia bacterium]
MILGVGIDVVHVERIRRWRRIEGLYERFFHPEELASALPRGETGILSLAARFAAKEAFGKAIGSGLRHFALRDIAVLNDSHGKPFMMLTGGAEVAFKDFGGSRLVCSLSHERDNALAVVLIEGDPL